MPFTKKSTIRMVSKEKLISKEPEKQLEVRANTPLKESTPESLVRVKSLNAPEMLFFNDKKDEKEILITAGTIGGSSMMPKGLPTRNLVMTPNIMARTLGYEDYFYRTIKNHYDDYIRNKPFNKRLVMKKRLSHLIKRTKADKQKFRYFGQKRDKGEINIKGLRSLFLSVKLK